MTESKKRMPKRYRLLIGIGVFYLALAVFLIVNRYAWMKDGDFTFLQVVHFFSFYMVRDLLNVLLIGLQIVSLFDYVNRRKRSRMLACSAMAVVFAVSSVLLLYWDLGSVYTWILPLLNLLLLFYFFYDKNPWPNYAALTVSILSVVYTLYYKWAWASPIYIYILCYVLRYGVYIPLIFCIPSGFKKKEGKIKATSAFIVLDAYKQKMYEKGRDNHV